MAAARDEIPAAWLLTGPSSRSRERLGEYAEAGVERVMFQHHLFRDLDAVALIGSV